MKKPSQICPPNTQCRNCMHYTFDANLGLRETNYKGSFTEVGNCTEFGYVYAEWFGNCNVHLKDKKWWATYCEKRKNETKYNG